MNDQTVEQKDNIMSHHPGPVNKDWQEFFTALQPEERQKLIEALREGYGNEVRNAARLVQHAEQMYYPQFGKHLLRIAAEQQAHVGWLRDSILALGGSLPQVSVPPKTGANNWESLLLDLEEEKQNCREILIAIQAATHADTDIVAGLRRIYNEEAHHREEIRDMLMKSQPYTAPILTRQQEQAAEKEIWLEEQKNGWLARGQAEWEANGKQVPWVEWVREQEYRWTAELPNRELAWAEYITNREQGHVTEKDN